MLGQKGGSVWASSPFGDTSGGYTVSVEHRDISAEVALTIFHVLGGEGVHGANVGISQVVSDEKGVENFDGIKPGVILRKGVTSITFYVSIYKGYVEGRWLINYWS